MGVNDLINYKFPYRWSSEGMYDRPKVNLLLKAIIEEDFTEMYSLVKKGASIYKLDQSTLGRVLFEKINNISIAEFFIDCGARGYNDNMSCSMYNELYDEYGYCSGGMALAYYRNNYDMFNLLASNGFSKSYICFNGRGVDLLDLIKQRDDAEALSCLLKYSFPRQEIEWKFDKTMNTRCGRFLIEHPIVYRQSAALDPGIFRCKEISYPELKTPKFLHKRENQLLIADYEDKVKVREMMLSKIKSDKQV